MKISRELPPDAYQFDFIVCEEGGCYTEEVLSRGGRIYPIPKRTEDLWGAMHGIMSVVRKNRYDTVLKLGNPPIAVLDLIAARLGGARCLAMRSCNALTGLPWHSRVIDAILRPVLNICATVKLAPSMLAAEYTFGKRAAHRSVHLLHNGLDLSVFRFDQGDRAQIRREFALEDRLVVGHIGRFHKQKNHPFLLEVFHRIHAQRPDALLLLVGTGEKEGQIREQIRQLGLQEHVILTGTRFDIPKLLSAMDVFVFPSLYEGMPNTVIEAQATGLPCIIADTITPEADITGLVRHLPLTASADLWADAALNAVSQQRQDTHPDFLRRGYDIQSAARDFVRLIWSDDTAGSVR